MANFELEYSHLLKVEGGYVNDKDDNGGETYKGIARKFNPKWTGWIIVDAIKSSYPNTFKKELDNNEDLKRRVKLFYKTNYWDKLRLDEVNNQEIAHQLFDDAVNRGVKATILIAQNSLHMSRTGVMSDELIYNLNGKKNEKK